MGQIIFPTTLDWGLGAFTNTMNVGNYLRLEYYHETRNASQANALNNNPAIFVNGRLCWDLSNVEQSGGVSYATYICHLLYNTSVSAGGGMYIYPYWVVRDATSFIGLPIDDNDIVMLQAYGKPQYRGAWHAGKWYRQDSNYTGTYEHTLRYMYIIAATASYGVDQLLVDVLESRFKTSGEWLSPIIDMGPYIHITSLSVTNYVVPTGGAVNIYFRTSGSAPTTGSPTAFTDTSGNTLYYYPANATWTASDWELVPSGSAPSYKDRYVQLKLELIGA